MAWYDNMLTPLRVLINDLDESSPKYTDETLQKLLVTAAAQVKQEIRLTTTYNLDYSVPSISPDPSEDNIFTNFVVLKAACLTNQWDINAKAITQGVSARCGPVSMSVSDGGTSVYIALLEKGLCAAYKQLQLQHNIGNFTGTQSILTPFSHSDYDYGSSTNDRR